MPHKNTNYAYEFIYQLIYQLFNFLKSIITMSSITNQVHILGHLGKNPEIKTTTTGKKNARFNVAAREAYVGADGKRVENTQWITVVAWDGLATISEKYLVKGKQVAVCGRLNTRQYQDAKGETRWITEVVATDILLLGGKPQAEQEA
jgi:single-strand DNA-binding protein